MLEELAVKEFPDTKGVFFCVKRTDEAAERGEWRE